VGVIYRENAQVHPRTPRAPQAEQSQFLRHLLLGGLDLEVYLVILDCLSRVTTKKMVVNFF